MAQPPELTKFDYFRLEREYEESEAIAARTSYLTPEWLEEADKIDKVRAQHPDWHAEYMHALREGREPVAQPDPNAAPWDIEILAVLESEMSFGCPYCGHNISWELQEYNGAVLCRCHTGGCGRDFVELSAGMTFSPFTFNGVPAKIVPHPLRKED